MSRTRLVSIVVSAGLLISVLATLAGASAAPAAQSGDTMEVMRLEVSGNAAMMVIQEQPANAEGLPLHGNPFIITGYLYPEGTLNESNGVLANGDPEFPDLVMGTWICSGWFYGESLTSPTGPYAITTQQFELTDQPGERSITTYGFEIGDYEIPLQRTILGGTGDYAGARGQQLQTHFGDNPTGGPNLLIEFQMGEAD